MNKLFSVMLLSLFLIACSSSENSAINQVSPMESAGLQSNGFAVIVDVRTDNEWNQQRIPGAIHIPLNELKSRIDELKAYEGKQLIMQGTVGGRSSDAVEILQQAGFNNASNMDGGIVAWNKAKLPLE